MTGHNWTSRRWFGTLYWDADEKNIQGLAHTVQLGNVIQEANTIFLEF